VRYVWVDVKFGADTYRSELLGIADALVPEDVSSPTSM
jgi:hypothetical protein